MATSLINLLIAAIIFAAVAYALYYICTHFFPNFPPALWISGAILVIILLLWISGQLGGPVIVPIR